uniref:Uncharacterized protein n=1 Tax=Arundo donax TaxID=35708 RepID=A0A0A9HQU3_ARUDO
MHHCRPHSPRHSAHTMSGTALAPRAQLP